MKFRALIIVALSVGGTANASDSGQALAQRNVCLACHQVDTKRVGPSFRDIGIRYAGTPQAAQYLSRSIREGSRGLWGAIPMPAQRQVDPATALRLADWILSLAPSEDASLPESAPDTSNPPGGSAEPVQGESS